MKIEKIIAGGRIKGAEAGQLLLQDFATGYRDFMAGGEGEGLMNDLHFQLLQSRMRDAADVQQYNMYVSGCRFLQQWMMGCQWFASRLDSLVTLLWHAVSRLWDAEREYIRAVRSPRIISRQTFSMLKENGFDADTYPGGVAVLIEKSLPVRDTDAGRVAFDDDGNYRPANVPVWTSHLAETFLSQTACKLPTLYAEIETTLAEMFIRRSAMQLLIEYLAVPELKDILPPTYDTALLDGINTISETLPARIVRRGLFPHEKPATTLRDTLRHVLRPIPHTSFIPTPSTVEKARNAVGTHVFADEPEKILKIFRDGK